MDKRFLGILGAIAVIFVGILIFTNKDSSHSTANPTNHLFGDNAKHVTLVEYGDFQCPACGGYEPTVEQVRTKYKADISFQFRNLPLIQVHQNAFAGARAAEAADLQGKFWDMHDLLYQNQQTWSASSDPLSYFKQYAGQIGLNVNTFTKDYSSSKVNDTINADLDAFKKLNLPMQTPTFLLDGKHVTPGATVEDFSKLIDAEIKQKNGGSASTSSSTTDTTATGPTPTSSEPNQ